MSTTPDVAPAAKVIHPDWCDPTACRPDGSTVTHRSRPVTWRMEGEDVDVAMRRQQDGLDGGVLIELHLANDAFAEAPTTLLLTERDVHRLVTGVLELQNWP